MNNRASLERLKLSKQLFKVISMRLDFMTGKLFSDASFFNTMSQSSYVYVGQAKIVFLCAEIVFGEIARFCILAK